jgi:S1-C subfamily serine protease
MEKANSVICLIVTKAIYNFKRPYQNFKDKEITGSSFIIDVKNGYVLTNAHVVENCISIVGRLPKMGKKDISLELIGICREKDLAVLKIVSTDLALITSGLTPIEIENLNLKFADSMSVKAGDVVKTIGYPLDSNSVKITTGIVSGFERVERETNEREDTISRSPCYIQISAAINPGNSGGPLLNDKGEVIGINAAGYLYAQNIGYAIPSRTFLAIYPELLKNGVVNMPTLALDWCKTNREIMKKQTGNSSTYGIYVKRVYPDTCCDVLERGDVIRRIDYMDTFWKVNGESNRSAFNLSENAGAGTLVTIFIDRFGMSTSIGRLKNPSEADESKIEFEKIYTDRKLEISEIMDMVPIGSDIMLNMCRINEGKPIWYMLKTKYVYTPNDRIPYLYSTITPIDYEIFAGICITDLSMNVMRNFENLDCYSSELSNLYKRQVIIVQIFPETTAYKTDSIKAGHLIKSVFGYNQNMELLKESHRAIQTLEDVRHVLRLRPDYIEVTCTDNSVFLFSTANVQKEDAAIFQKYNIHKPYIFS